VSLGLEPSRDKWTRSPSWTAPACPRWRR
jgi:hypothetical protein